MDAVGSLDLVWAQGYNGDEAQYIASDTIAFQCGNSIKFITHDGVENVFAAPCEGIGAFAVHPINKVFAISDINIQPTIYIYQYPSFREIAQLAGGASLEYTMMAFSASEYLATITGVPDHKIILWHYPSGKNLCDEEVSKLPPTCLTFNPANWRQLCISTSKEISVWSIEQRDDVYWMHREKLKLPDTLARVGAQFGGREIRIAPADREFTATTRAASRATPCVPTEAIAGVKDDDAERFADYRDDKPRVVPLHHCWTPAGDIFVGCAGGQLLRIDGDQLYVRMLLNPEPRSVTMMRPDSSITSELETCISPSRHSLFDEPASTERIQSGSLDRLALHKKGLFGGGSDGTLRHMEVSSGDQVKVLNTYNLSGQPISHIAFNATHHRMAVCSVKGVIYAGSPDNPGDLQEMCDLHYGPVIGLDMLAPGNETVVSVRKDGEIQVWDMHTAKLLSALPLCYEASCLVASPLHHIVAIGTIAGYLFFVDFNDLDKPRIVERIHLHQGPVKHVAFGQNGHFLVSGGDDGSVFIIDGRASKKYKPLGYVSMAGDVMGLDCYYDSDTDITKVCVTANQSKDRNSGATRIMHFDLPEALASNPVAFHTNLKCELKDEPIKKLLFNLADPSFGVTVTAVNHAYALSQKTKKLNVLHLPDQAPKKETSKDSYLVASEELDGHELAGGNLCMSPHNKWVASYGVDGKLIIRMVTSLDRPIVVTAHSYRTGGIVCMAFSSDTSAMFTGGMDGTIACFKWNGGQSKAKSAVEEARIRLTSMMKELEKEDATLVALPEWEHPKPSSRPASGTEKADREKLEKVKKIEEAIEQDNIFSTPTPTPGADATWMEERELEAHVEEDKQYAGKKKELRTQIRDIRRQLQTMITENNVVMDIEQLARHEFDLDIEEQRRLQAEGDAEVARIREEKEFENLAKQYLTHLIKKECWDDMEVKGRGIQFFCLNPSEHERNPNMDYKQGFSLSAFSTPLEVQNYPLKPRSRDEITRIRQVETRRRIEIAEKAAREEFAEIDSKTAANASAAADEDIVEEDAADVAKERAATAGSLGALFGGANDLLYGQFELHTREEKLNQIVMLEDAIYRVKKTFNKEFDKVYEKKEQEIAKIRDKNKRIRKILSDLDQPAGVIDPALGIIEKPELLLSVTDEEVQVEKFLSPEQRKKREEERLAEEERKAREKGDNWRDRGLDMMMGGVLEIKKEDELKKDVPQPAFMTAKAETEWSEDEKKAAAEYERKVKELNEEREKYRKQLEMELKKLQGLIQDGTDQFDEALKVLFQRKIKMEMVIYQEELKILRLRCSLLEEEELDNREAQLNSELEHKKKMKEHASEALLVSRKHVDDYREQYDKLCAEDKVMDRGFKREFTDIPAHQVDALYKLFRRRPRGQKARGTETPIYDPSSGNPFAERPSTARVRDQSKNAVEIALTELDKDVNCPDGVEPAVWVRMCNLRREKIESELLVKTRALTLASMQDFLQKRHDDDEHLREDIDNLIDDLSRLKEDRLRFTCNLQVQLLLKQGQVEVDPTDFIPEYTRSLLLHRSVVEELNGRIRNLGEKKISSMMESKDFRKGIVQLEWEHKRMTMEMEDLQNKMRDIQNLKVTREIQAYLSEADHDHKKAQEIQILEQTLVVMKQHHEKYVAEKKKQLKEHEKSKKILGNENQGVAQQLEELNVSVNERKHIHDVNADTRQDASNKEQKYKEIVQRRKLVDLAKAQAQEVAVLRAEVERLRMRTFPALVQVEH